MRAHSGQDLHWWQTRWFVLLCAVIAAGPLLWPEIPPLVDLPGHMGRYRVQLDRDQYQWFNDWYKFQWSLIGNLGVDLLIIPLGKIFGIELGVKLIVLAIPVLTVTGLLWIAREVHGRIPATALFALPFAYGYPFHFGFVNFALSMALGLNAFAWWLRLSRLGKLRLRAVVFVPLSMLLWVCHTYGWGLLGVLAFSAELIRQHDQRMQRGVPWYRDLWGGWVVPWFLAGLNCLVLAPPVLMMLEWRGGHNVSGATWGWFNWRAKASWVAMVFRDRWQLFDLSCVGIVILILLKGLRDSTVEYSSRLGISALFLLGIYLLLPQTVFGSTFADMRLVPFMLAVAMVALRPRDGIPLQRATLVAVLGMSFFGMRMAATAASYWLYDRTYQRELVALDHLPIGARLLTLVGESCQEWKMSRLRHLPALALERRMAFANDQWSMEGAQLLTVRYDQAGPFAQNPSEIVTDSHCPRAWQRPVSRSLAQFPRDAFDYVWLVRTTAYDPRLNTGLIPVWRDGSSALYRIDHAAKPPHPSA